MGIIRFGVKCALAGGAVYYLAEEGLWKNSEESEKIYGRINTAVKPYVKEATAQLPIEIPELPNTDKLNYLVKHYWNEGVMNTFKFLGNVPIMVSNYTQIGVNMIVNNEDLKGLLNNSGEPLKENVKK